MRGTHSARSSQTHTNRYKYQNVDIVNHIESKNRKRSQCLQEIHMSMAESLSETYFSRHFYHQMLPAQTLLQHLQPCGKASFCQEDIECLHYCGCHAQLLYHPGHGAYDHDGPYHVFLSPCAPLLLFHHPSQDGQQ